MNQITWVRPVLHICMYKKQEEVNKRKQNTTNQAMELRRHLSAVALNDRTSSSDDEKVNVTKYYVSCELHNKPSGKEDPSGISASNQTTLGAIPCGKVCA